MGKAKLVNERAALIEQALRDGLSLSPEVARDVASAVWLRCPDADAFQVLAAWIEGCLQTAQTDGDDRG